MHTTALRHPRIGTPGASLRALDFVLLAILAVALAVVAQSDRSQVSPAPSVSQPT